MGRIISTYSNRSAPDLNQMEQGQMLDRNVHLSTQYNANTGILKKTALYKTTYVDDFDTSRERVTFI
jgi:hypothetical protein